MTIQKYYPSEPVSIHIQLLINIIQETTGYLPTKKGKDKLPLFSGNEERVIIIYGPGVPPWRSLEGALTLPWAAHMAPYTPTNGADERGCHVCGAHTGHYQDTSNKETKPPLYIGGNLERHWRYGCPSQVNNTQTDTHQGVRSGNEGPNQ